MEKLYSIMHSIIEDINVFERIFYIEKIENYLNSNLIKVLIGPKKSREK